MRAKRSGPTSEEGAPPFFQTRSFCCLCLFPVLLLTRWPRRYVLPSIWEANSPPGPEACGAGRPRPTGVPARPPREARRGGGESAAREKKTKLLHALSPLPSALPPRLPHLGSHPRMCNEAVTPGLGEAGAWRARKRGGQGPECVRPTRSRARSRADFSLPPHPPPPTPPSPPPPQRFLVYGRTGWIGGLVGELLASQGATWEFGTARLEDRAAVLADFEKVGGGWREKGERIYW